MRSTLIEEVGESLVPEGTPAHGTRRTVVEVALNEATAAAVRRGSSPPTSELSTGKMNPRLLVGTRGQCLGDNIKFSIHMKIFSTIFPCFVRLRIGASAPSLTPCPTRISAFEKAVSVFVENPTEDEPWLVIWMN
ncbi:hypothetical protein TRIUR3_34374 [Triticum urartu]|uniref:Uncharacterized protein n=1 Tax=Triticum urartu TaxID=4572 RepID=M8AUH3_TRIUA|nr:hypothetical protein TRIUR3_34374 [Triticum urartu]